MYSALTFFIINFLMIYAQESTVVDLSEFDNSTDVQNLKNNTDPVDLNEIESSTIMQDLSNNTGPEAAYARRYGFQQTMTRACKNFAKTYLCVRKCLDFKYDIARSDRNCKCTCYKHAEKATFTMPLAGYTNGSRWMSGAPTTTIFVTPKFPPTFDDETLPDEEPDNNDGSGEKGSGEENGGDGSEKEDDKESDSNAAKFNGKAVTDEDGNSVTGEDGQPITEEAGEENGGDEKGEGGGEEEGGETKAEGEEEEGGETKAEEEGGAEGEGEAKEGEK